MGEKLVIGPFNKGLRNDVEPFNVDNDSFPVLINAYQWRGRIKRKRGTTLIGRLKRFFNSANASYGSISSFVLVGGAGNILTAFGLQTNGNIVPGTVHLTDSTTGNVFTDNSTGGLVGVPSGTGTINYATGAITITGGGGDTITTVSFLYYPDLPVMGLEDFISNSFQFPGTIAFDTTYAYDISNSVPFPIHDVSFYKNPVSAIYPGYVAKTTITPTTWNGKDYQQFWTTNYASAMWTTNGINVPFNPTNIGMQYNTITAIAIVAAGPPAIATITTTTNHGLSIGDFVFINEVVGLLDPTGKFSSIDFQTGYVTAVPALNQITVEFPNATLTGVYTSGGIVQYLTNRSNPAKDCLRWYDGDPTNGSDTAPVLNGHLGWVNFAPPLSFSNFSISDEVAAVYYLVGARMIRQFKDRLIFFGPVIQTSAANSQIYLQDTIIYSLNGTPYYTASFTGDPRSTATTFFPILTPNNETAIPGAYWEDISGYGGFLQAGFDQDILTVGANQDVLIVGFTRTQANLIYTGLDLIPFNFYVINSELGSGSTFSGITMDQGVITKGSRGFTITSQEESQRIDLEIPDEVFEVRLLDNGSERVTAQRDYISEWIYFTYPVNHINYKFPTQTLQYNYRDNSWAIFTESYTTYGAWRQQSGFTWATVGTVFPTWNQWNQPWSAGSSTLLNPEVIGGNQQGFVLLRNQGTGEATSLYIQNIVGSTVTSPDHCLVDGDFIVINNALGTVASSVNGIVFEVSQSTQNTFSLIQPIPNGLTYIGSGTITKIYNPFIQTKQFPTSWQMARKTRIGNQQYLLSTTNNAQITLLIFLSENSNDPYNDGPIVPTINSTNNSLIYSTILYTCPESTNLGLTPANINLQTPTAVQQQQIWHRVNTSLIGDTVQVGFTLNPTQLTDPTLNNQFAEIELHGIIMDLQPSQLLV